jgi:cold-inducible RNA-binding protein
VPKLHVGNLPPSANEATVRDLFAVHGDVDSVSLIQDRHTGKPRGFGFVEMPAHAATKAMAALNGSDLEGRALSVTTADEKGSGIASIGQWRGR